MVRFSQIFYIFEGLALSEFVYEDSHQLRYTNRKYVPIKSIIESLQALEGVVEETPYVLNGLTQSDVITRVEIDIKSIAAGSLIEDFVVRYFFKSEEGFNGWVDKLRKQSGMEDGKKIVPILIGSTITAVALLGVVKALPSGTGGQATSTITGNNNVVLNFVGQNLDMDAETVEKVISDSIRNQKKLAENAVKLVKPGKLDDEAQIIIDGNDQLVITKDTIKSAPGVYEPPKPAEKIDKYDRTLVKIRGTDRDNYRRGWSVILPGIAEQRVKLQLDENIDLNELAARDMVYANVDVIFKFDKSLNDYKVVEIYMNSWDNSSQ
ncbi:hypothetical protein GZ78_04050 [Endozoicomonas numazuensis]|uniref:Uncharacterized protein n=1 Tax=Endozoicomonas numazuensis TaxID=1137799 RepID=A0A081NL53_9GAMM|nr:hypothetical protein GZ78_04050 [Endozoicomonas numazuensis]